MTSESLDTFGELGSSFTLLIVIFRGITSRNRRGVTVIERFETYVLTVVVAIGS